MIISELESKIVDLSKSYYEGESKVPDSVFDELVDELRRVNPGSTILKSVGWGYISSKSKSRHSFGAVGSLQKIHSINRYITNDSVVVSSKLDGISLVVDYIDGNLNQIRTRGDGTVGQDITNKFYAVSETIGIPHNILGARGKISIRGELLIKKSVWIDKYSSDNISQRNYVSGLVNRDTGCYSDLEDLRFVTYKVHGWTDKGLESVLQVRKLLSNLGFETVKDLMVSNVVMTDSLMSDIRDELNNEYYCDGLVISDNDIKCSKDGSYDYTEVAYKFEAEKGISKVSSVDWNLTRTGKLVPVCNIDPIELSGAIIKRVTGFNYEYIKSNKIGVGSILEVARSGEVIPDIQRVIFTDDSLVNLPTSCPECGCDLVVSGVNLFCNNPDCTGLSKSNILHYIFSIIDIPNLGWSSVSSFLNKFGINSVVDLYELNNYESELLSIDGVGGTTYKLLIDMMSELRGPLNKSDFLVGCNIKGIGRKAANLLTTEDDNGVCPLDIIAMSDNKNDIRSLIRGIGGLGNSASESICRSLNYIKKLYSLVTFKDTKKTSNLVYKYVGVTGALSIKRSDFDKLISDNGWKISSNMSECEYLVTNNTDPTSSKYKKAMSIGLRVINESEFMKILGE